MHPPLGKEQIREAQGSSRYQQHPYGSSYDAAFRSIDTFEKSENGMVEEKEQKRKYWGKKWKFGKPKAVATDKDPSRTFLIHTDCISSFGTISPGLVNKSVKYAETWLYGTVGVRSVPLQRPSLFVYPGMVAQSPRINQYGGLPLFVPAQLCHCPDVRQGSLCERCNSRRESIRVPSKERPSLLKATCQEEPKFIANAPDPYNLMRISRLSINENSSEGSIIHPKAKHANKRTSPTRQQTGPLLATFKPSTFESSREVSPLSWGSDEDVASLSRKSILECSIDPYELNKKEDSSEELSDHQAEVNAKLKILRPKLKTEKKLREIKIPEPRKLDSVRLNGQRFRIFDNSNSSMPSVEEYVSDTEQTCPKRPPRRRKPGKSRSEAENFILNKNKSSSSPNLSIKSILKKTFDDSPDDYVAIELSDVHLDLKSSTRCSQNTLKKKKKQVQFQVKSSSESISHDLENLHVLNANENVDIQTRKNNGFEDDCPATLRRTYSDRRPTTAVVKYKDEVIQMSTSPPNSYLFNDTMALRTRTSRHDSREIFLDDSEGISFKANGKPRPKDPPPPPPPPPPPSPPDDGNNSAANSEQNNLPLGLQQQSFPVSLIGNNCENESLPSLPPSPSPSPPAAETIKLCDLYENRSKFINDKKTIVNVINSELKIISKNNESEMVLPSKLPALKDNINRVTISVRNFEEEPSTCTIIETGSNSTVIPIVSTDNKTTLVVGSVIAREEQPQEVPKYLFSSVHMLNDLDPVEAVKKNLVPHFCGKEASPPRQIDRLEALKTSEYLSPVWKSSEDNVSLTSLSNSFCDSRAESSRTTSRSSSFCSHEYASANSIISRTVLHRKLRTLSDSAETLPQELDKLEDEYIIRNYKRTDDENIYETIKEPIYDQIGVRLEKEEESEEDVPPPLPKTLPPSLEETRSSKSIFEGASKYDILSYLVDAKDRVQEDSFYSDHHRMESLDGSELSAKSIGSDSGIEVGQNGSDSSEDRDSLPLNRKGSVEIERNDSGVGSETSQSSRSRWQSSNGLVREDAQQHLCEDCDQVVETQIADSGVVYAPLVCRKCTKRRMERKEIIQEIVETEEKYGRDLRIILDEFYKPMLVAGLLTPEQLSLIFLNTEELLENSEALYDKLRDALDIALDQGDEDLLTVNIGRIFLESGQMLHAFESYCTRQASAAILLSNLEKEKELLRIFLRVSQMENVVLRRMNLNSFLMVPVQRVTKYPLLLARLYKVTPAQYEGRELLKEAQHNIELHLEHMNAEAKDIGNTKVWRRFSSSTPRRSNAELEMTTIKLRKMAVDLLEWNHEEVRFVLEGRLLFTQPTDGNWKRARTLKLQPIYVLLVTLGKPNGKYRAENLSGDLHFPTKTGIRESTLLLIKEKCGRFTLIREPLYLDKLIICCESDCDEYLEVQELISKETFLFKAEDAEKTKEWYRQLQYHAQILGGWRKRRNALANIMITGITYAG